MKHLSTLKNRLEKIEQQLEKVRGREYDLPLGTMRRAKISRSWDVLAMQKMEIIKQIEEHERSRTKTKI